MLPDVPNFIVVASMVIATVAIVSAYFAINKRVDDRHKLAAKDAVKLADMGVPFLPELLDAYAFHQLSDLGKAVVDAVKVVHDRAALNVKFDQFLRRQLELSVADPERAKIIAAIISNSTHVLDALVATGKVAKVVATAAAVVA